MNKISLLTLAPLLLAPLAAAFAADAPKPVKVFILAGQSNMEGQGVADLAGKDYNGGRGTLAALMRDPAMAARFKHLRDANGKWTVRNDVWVRYQREHGPLLAGPLSLGFSVYGDQHLFGPELQFGHVMGDALAPQVLLIKDVRRELNTPKLPVVIGELTGPWVVAPGTWATLRKAQAAVATHPEFAGTVTFVETHDFVRKPEDSPNPSHGHHEFGNAETYFLVGDALAQGMKRLLMSTVEQPHKAVDTAKP